MDLCRKVQLKWVHDTLEQWFIEQREKGVKI